VTDQDDFNEYVKPMAAYLRNSLPENVRMDFDDTLLDEFSRCCGAPLTYDERCSACGRYGEDEDDQPGTD
jgi:hypothetical protein